MLVLINTLVSIELMLKICICVFFVLLIGWGYFCNSNKKSYNIMEKVEHKVMRRFILFWGFLFGMISSGFCLAENKDVDLDGKWIEKERSVTSYPITVSIVDNFLLIEAPFSHADIKIQILEGGDIVYEELMPADLSVYSVFWGELVGSKSCYRVVLTNQRGGYLEGEFSF